MKKFYSILKISPSIALGDSIAIGIILFNENSFNTYFSSEKIRAVKKIINNESIDIEQIINQIEHKLNDLNTNQKDLRLFYKFENLTNINYFEYLGVYSNGLLQFSKPYLLNDSLDIDFTKLVESLFKEKINDTIANSIIQDDYSEMVQTKLISRVENRVHTNFKFNQTVNPSIYFNFEMDCIGKNGALIGAKSLGFDKSKTTLDKDVSHYFTLISILSNQYNMQLKDNSFYLIAREPSDIDSDNHKIWESVNNNNFISVIDPEQSDEVADKIIQKEATLFI